MRMHSRWLVNNKKRSTRFIFQQDHDQINIYVEFALEADVQLEQAGLNVSWFRGFLRDASLSYSRVVPSKIHFIRNFKQTTEILLGKEGVVLTDTWSQLSQRLYSFLSP